jgi:flagellar hook-length control protein FliK
MSVAIVSTLPKAVQTKAAGSAADNTEASAPGSDSSTSGVDFASLLLGQLAPQVLAVQPEITAQTDLPSADATTTDNAALFAALGIVPLEPGRNTDNALGKEAALTDSGKLESSMRGALTAQQTAANAGQQLKTEGKTESVPLESTLTGTLAADDQPAKLAAASAVASIVDSGTSSKDSAGAAPISPSTLTNMLHGSPGNLTASREPEISIPTSIRDQNWASDFGQKIVWLAGNDKHSAQLSLNPAQMGPIEISLNVDKGNVSAAFVSANADVREAIESALPRLREMFASAGIELGQTNVSAESFKQQAGSESDSRNASQRTTDNAILVANSAGSLPARTWATQQGNGLVDIFA